MPGPSPAAALDLPAPLLALVPAQRLDREGAHGDPDETRALLEARGFPAHAPALALEARFGGGRLLEPDADPPALVIGPFACLSAGPYRRSERDLVPVVFGLDDTVYSLDGRGRGWTCAAMVEGASRPSARDGRLAAGCGANEPTPPAASRASMAASTDLGAGAGVDAAAAALGQDAPESGPPRSDIDGR